MRVQHSGHSFSSFPVYSSDFISDNELVLGGGGGASRSGIKNRLKLVRVSTNRSIEEVSEYELEAGEDAPMSIAANRKDRSLASGINSTDERVKQGDNENCRVFNLVDNKFTFITKTGTLNNSEEEFQKVTVLSNDGSILAAAGPYTLDLLSYPLLAPLAPTIKTEKEIYDAAFDGDTLVVVTTGSLLVYELSKPSTISQYKKGKQKPPTCTVTLRHTVNLPESIPNGSFRAGKFHPTDNGTFYAAINTAPIRSKKSKSMPRQAFVSKWDTKTWTVEKSRKIGDRALTCFTVSPNGRWLGFGSSDLAIGLLEANTLALSASVLNSHEFPPTTIAFNPTSELFVSGSADNSIRVVSVPTGTESYAWSIIVLILITLLVLLLALYVQS
ncbi:WD40 repeat-like protein [Cylindrobasidium torrendii FP15055 ss-10]|uniref:WD40 repeat-like protein n=1 Tax=Cylindrobasidium torrendii FP15055 ss-10 TaxID=1314674 RepID=A0A0D7BR89_9AGAR|nr:WD40 repeat-like protein [Cylindrobasidium torrendii FP15055 ss-10]